MVKEITISDPITYEGQPDGGSTPMIDPYDGCQFHCPYCFQLSDEKWNKDIYVNLNIADLLSARLESWPKSKTIYLGSKCDPYMQLEETYQLTRNCLKVLRELNINTMITTKSDNGLIYRDLEILKSFSGNLTVLMGLANMNQISKGIKNSNIETANDLYDNHIPVWVFITPVLPYIMEVEDMISSLHPGIPVFLDKLRISKGSIQANKMKTFILGQYPYLSKKYDKVIDEGEESYFNNLVDRYSNNDRIKILF